VLPQETVDAIARTRSLGGRVIAVGTTSARVLETCTDDSGATRAQAGSTRLFIQPGRTFRCIDGLLTNFHLPRSTLIVLVSAFAGRERVLSLYREALERGYRFYSYGDAMLLLNCASWERRAATISAWSMRVHPERHRAVSGQCASSACSSRVARAGSSAPRIADATAARPMRAISPMFSRVMPPIANTGLALA
jgi:hypothetical protein